MLISSASSILIILITVLIGPSESARILGIVPTPSYSHQVAFRPLWKELLKHGHHLTLVTTHPMQDATLTNLTEISTASMEKTWKDFIHNVVDGESGNPLKFVQVFLDAMDAFTETYLQSREIQGLIHNENDHYDVLLVEAYLSAFYAFSHRFRCPYILITSLDAYNSAYTMMGNPTHPILDLDVNLPFHGQLTFSERLLAVLFDFYMKIATYTGKSSPQELLIKKYFGKEYPSLEELKGNVSLLFVNTNPILQDHIRPLVPAVINIGRETRATTEAKKSVQLPKYLQDYLKDATDGFIYFSLGSNVKGTDLPDSLRDIILNTFSELPYKVLWKFESENLSEKPKNVLISKWFPQEDIFKHPNIKLFITQGGLQSIEEAVYNYIPMIGIPFYGDQHQNVKRIVQQGLGLSIDHKTLDKKSFKDTILEVIKNPTYAQNVRKLAELAKDEPMTGLERAVWWTEYVVRHKGAKHLRSPILKLPFYQYYLLDIIGFCLTIIIITSYLFIKIIKFMKRLITGSTLAKAKVKRN